MSRFEDWPRRLDAAIEAACGRPFSWGGHDCVLFAAGVVEVLTGSDLAAPWRGTYDSEISALRVLRAHGGLEAMVTAALGTPVSPTLAQRGDVVLRNDPVGPALGICAGVRCAFAGLEGLLMRPLEECALAWHV